MIDLLRRTGTPQTGTRLVGPLPNLAAALKDIEVDGPVTSASLSPAGVEGWYLNPTITLTADDGWGVGVKPDSIEYRLDGGAWTPYTAPFRVLTPNAHVLETRALDLKGNTATRSTTFNVYDLDTPVGGTVGGAVPATLSLTLGTAGDLRRVRPGRRPVLHRGDHGERDLLRGRRLADRGRPERRSLRATWSTARSR